MNVAQYTFQSPSTNAVQVGKLDQSSIKEDTKSTSTKEAAVDSKTINELAESVGTQNKLDLYA